MGVLSKQIEDQRERDISLMNEDPVSLCHTIDALRQSRLLFVFIVLMHVCNIITAINTLFELELFHNMSPMNALIIHKNSAGAH